MAGAAAAPIQLAEVGEFGDIGPRLNGAAVAAFGPTPKVGEFGPPIQVAASFGGCGGVGLSGGGVEANPGGGVRTSLPTLGCRVNPTFVTSSPALALEAVEDVDPAQVALGSFHTMAVLHEGQTFAPSGTAAPQ